MENYEKLESQVIKLQRVIGRASIDPDTGEQISLADEFYKLYSLYVNYIGDKTLDAQTLQAAQTVFPKVRRIMAEILMQADDARKSAAIQPPEPPS